jgi:hypothetical protein
MANKKYYVIGAMLFSFSSLQSRDVLLEFKGAYFLPTDSVFKKIYHGGALYGPEITVQLCCDANVYGFVSVDFLQKNGKSIGFNSPTKVRLIPLGVGLKYFVPFCFGDFYVGLGFQPTYLHTKDDSPLVIPKHSKWGFGGIAKIGSYFDLPHNFFIDLFIDYSFVKVPFHNTHAPTGPVVPRTANVSGAIFGAGVGYRFN